MMRVKVPMMKVENFFFKVIPIHIPRDRVLSKNRLSSGIFGPPAAIAGFEQIHG